MRLRQTSMRQQTDIGPIIWQGRSPSYRETLLQVGTAFEQDGHGFIQNIQNIQGLTTGVVVALRFCFRVQFTMYCVVALCHQMF